MGGKGVSPPRRKGTTSYPTLAEGDVLEQAQARLQAMRRRIDRQLDAVRPPVAPQQRLVLGDGVHLFDPLAPHHEVLAREGTASMSKGERALGTLGPRVLMEGWWGVSARARGRRPCLRMSAPWVQGWSWRLLEDLFAQGGVACVLAGQPCLSTSAHAFHGPCWKPTEAFSPPPLHTHLPTHTHTPHHPCRCSPGGHCVRARHPGRSVCHLAARGRAAARTGEGAGAGAAWWVCD